MHTKGLSAVLALGALVSAGGVRAQDGTIPAHPMMSDRFFLSAGWFFGNSNTQAAVNSGTVGIGTFVDFENDLGLEERKAVPQLKFGWRISDRWRFETDYFRTKRDKDTTLGRTVSFGDQTFSLSTNIHSSFTFEDARVAVGYSFFRTKDKEVGVGLGIHQTKLEASLETGTGQAQRASKSAPLPTMTVYSMVALTDRWLLSMRIDRLAAGSGDTDGSVSNTGFDFIYQPWRNVNLGIGYRDIAMEISSSGGSWVGSAQVQQRGPLVFIGTTF